MDGCKAEIIKLIESVNCGYPAQTVFDDFVKISALAIVNSLSVIKGSLWKTREDEYLKLYAKYKNCKEKPVEFLSLLTIAFEQEITDILGEAYMEIGSGNKQTGQFFTPFHLCSLLAKLTTADYQGEKVAVYEPSVGAGANIIALAKMAKDKGINYQNSLIVKTQDIEWRTVYMAYLQFSLLGINGVVVQGDSLSGKNPEPYQIFRTPKNMGVIL